MLRLRALCPLAGLLFIACGEDERAQPDDAGRADASVDRDTGIGVDANTGEDAGATDTALADTSQPNDAGAEDTSTGGEDAQAPDTGGSVLPTLSDDFEGNTLDPSWQWFKQNLVTPTVANGSLTMVMTSPSRWYNTETAALMYKDVTGDFKFTGRVHARRSSDTSQLPSYVVHLGGLMARNGSGGSENY